jgi:hypothetical protein
MEKYLCSTPVALTPTKKSQKQKSQSQFGQTNVGQTQRKALYLLCNRRTVLAISTRIELVGKESG